MNITASDVRDFVASLNKIKATENETSVKEMLDKGMECYEFDLVHKQKFILTKCYSPFDKCMWLRPYTDVDGKVYLDLGANEHSAEQIDKFKSCLVGLPKAQQNQIMSDFIKTNPTHCELKDYKLKLKCGIRLFSDQDHNLTKLYNVDTDSFSYGLDCNAIAFGNSFCTEPLNHFSKHNRLEWNGKSYRKTKETNCKNVIERVIEDYYPHTIQAITNPKDANDLLLYPINTLYNTEKIYLIKFYKEYGEIVKIKLYCLLRRNSPIVSSTTKQARENIDFIPTFNRLHEMLKRQDKKLLDTMSVAEKNMKPLPTLMKDWTDYKDKYRNVVLPLPNAQLKLDF